MNLGVYSVFRKEFTTGVKCTAYPFLYLRGGSIAISRQPFWIARDQKAYLLLGPIVYCK